MARMTLRNAQLIISDSENPMKQIMLTFASVTLPASANNRLKHTFKSTSDTIRSLLTNIAPTQSLNDLAHTDEIIVTLLPKDYAKEVRKAKNVLPLDKLPTYSCNWCATHVDDEDSIRPVHESLSEFNEIVSDTNIHRLQIYFDEETIIEHILTDHVRTPPDTLVPESFQSLCCMVIPCRVCFSAYIRDNETNSIHNIFCCSLTCFFDHIMEEPIHHDDPLVSLIINLRAQFSKDHRMLGLIDRFFQVMCPICPFTAQNKDELFSHFKGCVTRIMSLSLRYGIPYDYDAFFSTPFMRKKERQARQEAAYTQTAHFVEALKTTYRRTSTTTSNQPTHLLGKVRSLRDVEAEFSFSSTSKQGQQNKTTTTNRSNTMSTYPTDQQEAQNSNFFDDDIDLCNDEHQISSPSLSNFSASRPTTPTRSTTNDIDYDSDNSSVICLDDPPPVPPITDSRILSLLEDANSIVKTEGADSPVSSPPNKKTKSHTNKQI